MPSPYADLFRAEAREHIAVLNQSLLGLERDARSPAALDEAFRSVHSLKGMAGVLEHAYLAGLAHAAEHLLDALRTGGRAVDAETLQLLFEAADALESSVDAATGAAPPAEPGTGTEAAHESELLRRLGDFADEPEQPDEPAETDQSDESRPRSGTAAGPAAAERSGAMAAGFGTLLRVRVVAASGAALPGARLFLAFQQALQLGTVRDAAGVESRLRAGRGAEPLELLLRTDRSPAEVERRLAAVGEIEELSVEPAPAEPASTASSTAGASRVRSVSAGDGAERAAYIRVRQDRLDTLLNHVGELVIVRDRLRDLVAARGAPELDEAMEQASRIIAEMRDEVMLVRMVPVWQVFDRFPRLVRDAAASLGKQVDFEMEGREIELDRALLDELRDPLIHLLRNALDHGVESPAARREAGKPATARLRLRVERERGGVRIDVQDDGRGIQRERVRRVARERGLLAAADADAPGLDGDELLQLLVRPGFTTAERVTELSGRGVGLDVVAARIRSLGGMLEVHSDAGQGTTFSLRLPLSLTLMRALLVRSAGAPYALPLAAVLETAEAEPAHIERVARAGAGEPGGGAERLRLRGESVPLVALHRILQTSSEAPRPDPLPVVVLAAGAHRVAVAVDELCGQQEVVMKHFDATLDTAPVFLGATILSDARPALVFDVPSLAARAAALGPHDGAGTPREAASPEPHAP